MRDMASHRHASPAYVKDERGRAINLPFRGTSDARSSVDRDTRIRIALSTGQAARLWYLLGERLTDEEGLNAARAAAE